MTTYKPNIQLLNRLRDEATFASKTVQAAMKNGNYEHAVKEEINMIAAYQAYFDQLLKELDRMRIGGQKGGTTWAP